MSSGYEDYVQDESFIDAYLAYQERWATSVRESDRVLIGHVSEAVAGLRQQGRDPLVIDIGCSNGNLLRHLRVSLPGVRLAGADYSRESVEACLRQEDLSGIPFSQIDVVQMSEVEEFDVAVVNAVLYLLDAVEFETALAGLARSLRPQGKLIVFDFFHPFPQDLAIVETSRSHPSGLPLHFRSIDNVTKALDGAGFASSTFVPFEIPIDLSPDVRFGDNESGFEDLNSYTVRTEEGRRLLFRGTLFQPWCHLVATKGP